MTEKKQSQRHWTIAKTAAREAKIAAAIKRTGVKGISELVDRLLDMEEMFNGATQAQSVGPEPAQP